MPTEDPPPTAEPLVEPANGAPLPPEQSDQGNFRTVPVVVAAVMVLLAGLFWFFIWKRRGRVAE